MRNAKMVTDRRDRLRFLIFEMMKKEMTRVAASAIQPEITGITIIC